MIMPAPIMSTPGSNPSPNNEYPDANRGPGIRHNSGRGTTFATAPAALPSQWVGKVSITRPRLLTKPSAPPIPMPTSKAWALRMASRPCE